MLAYERAMEELHAKYPSDPEAAVFYALALLGGAASLPPDKTYARQKRAGELLQPIFRRRPDHPGVAHYIIHAYERQRARSEHVPIYLYLRPRSPS